MCAIGFQSTSEIRYLLFACSRCEFLALGPHVKPRNHFLLAFDLPLDSGAKPRQIPAGGESTQTHWRSRFEVGNETLASFCRGGT